MEDYNAILKAIHAKCASISCDACPMKRIMPFGDDCHLAELICDIHETSKKMNEVN